MKVSEHPFLMSFLNLSLEAQKQPGSWWHVGLLPDIEVSNLEKEVSNNKLAMKRLLLYHNCSAFLHKAFQDPNKARPSYVAHGSMVWAWPMCIVSLGRSLVILNNKTKSTDAVVELACSEGTVVETALSVVPKNVTIQRKWCQSPSWVDIWQHKQGPCPCLLLLPDGWKLPFK